jgi:UDP-glucose 4-epimerase
MPAESNERVLVTGATGAIGPTLVDLLRRSDYRVRTLCRHEPDPGLFPDGVEVRIGDVTDPVAVSSAMENVAVVFHLAALLHVLDPLPSIREAYERINVKGTANVVEAALNADVQRLIFFSTIAVYGNGAGEVLNEDSPPRPETLYARTKLNAEEIVLNARRADGQALGTVLRLGAVYGARIKGNYYRLLHSLARRRFVPIGNGNNRRTVINTKDVARAALLVVRHPAAVGKVYNVSDGQFHTINRIIITMCDSLGRNPPAISLPALPARLAAGVVESALRAVGLRSSINLATVDKYTEDIAVDSHRIQTELGFEAEIDLTTGWREAISEMRKNGDL